MHEQVPRIIDDLLADQFSYFYRTRALFELENKEKDLQVRQLCLNEIFAAEKDVSCTSMYKLVVDGMDMGKFKSSGIIISTGTGSSGWLYSARQITAHDVSIIQNILGVEAGNNSEHVRYQELQISG
jgi:NAD kinase